MALYDENGKITIDENAARYDINRLQEAITYLSNSKKTLDNLIQQAAATQGDTGTAVVEKATELRNQVASMIAKLDETKSFISKTVSHYQWLDQQVKNIINSSKTGGDE